MAKITGIGGLFFRSKDHKATAEWYEKHLGIKASGMDYWAQEAGPTVLAAFKQDTTYFANESQQFMINFRVEGIDELVEKLKADGVHVDDSRMDESYGKFAWIYDLDGNKIELWEPAGE